MEHITAPVRQTEGGSIFDAENTLVCSPGVSMAGDIVKAVNNHKDYVNALKQGIRLNNLKNDEVLWDDFWNDVERALKAGGEL